MTSASDAGRFLSHIEAGRREEDLFQGLYVTAEPEQQTVAALRRRRRRAVNEIDSTMKAVSLVEENGTLYWRDGIPSRPAARRRGRRGLDATSQGSLVLAKEFPTLAPNKIIAVLPPLSICISLGTFQRQPLCYEPLNSHAKSHQSPGIH